MRIYRTKDGSYVGFFYNKSRNINEKIKTYEIKLAKFMST